jgi:hypothetical protein
MGFFYDDEDVEVDGNNDFNIDYVDGPEPYENIKKINDYINNNEDDFDNEDDDYF